MIHLKPYVKNQNSSNDELSKTISEIKRLRYVNFYHTNRFKMKFRINVGGISPVEVLKYMEELVKSIK